MRSVDSRAENDRDVFDTPRGFSLELPRHSETAEGIAAACEATVKLIDQELSVDNRLLGLWRRLGSALADYQMNSTTAASTCPRPHCHYREPSCGKQNDFFVPLLNRYLP